MKLSKSKNCNVNYLAKIVDIKEFTPHSNPEVTKLKCAHVDGYNIIVGINEEPNKFVYFPTSSCINPKLLEFANLYRHSEKNANSEITGLFEDNGRVKAVRLKGVVSEGFLLPLQVMLNFIVDSTNVNFTEDECPAGTEFDEIEHNGKSFWINKKYVVEVNNKLNGSQANYNKRQRNLNNFNRVIENQFRYHYDTVIYRKEPTAIKPNDLIHISDKWHGTSGIFAYVLCKHPLSWKEKIAKFFTGEEFNKYEYLYASRSVIKNANINPKVGKGYYGENGDVWGEAFKHIKSFLIKGMTIYAEIVGFTPNGGYIQKNYDYGCVMPKDGETYTYGKHFKVMIYRITMTNPDGIVHEFSTREVQLWCNYNGLTPVIERYYGLAKDLYPELDTKNNWNENFIESLANDERFYMEKNSPDCVNKVPHEGIVLKKEDMISRAWKLKCFRFIQGESAELDAGETNIEDLA